MTKPFNSNYLAAISFFLVFPFLLQAQKVPVSKKHNNGETINIELYSAYKNAKTYPLSAIAENVEYIPLETTKENLLGNISNIIMTSGDIFIYSYEGICYRFDRQGKFLNKIGRIGRGPGECMQSRDATIDTINYWVYILDYDKIVKYDYDGNFLESFRPGTESALGGYKILAVKPGLFLIDNISYIFNKPGERFSFYFFKEEQKNYTACIACEKKDRFPFCVNMPCMYRFNQNIFINDAWSDTIYRVKDPLNLEAYATMNLGRLKYREMNDNSILSGKRSNGEEWLMDKSMMVESGRYIFIRTNKGLFFFDKAQKETYCTVSIQSGNNWGHYINDFISKDNALPIKITASINNNTLISYYDAYQFFEDGIDVKNSQIRKLIQNLKVDDNPVLVLVKLKE